MNIEDETVGIAPLEGISDRLNGNSPLPFVFFFKWEINSPLHNVATCIKFYPVSWSLTVQSYGSSDAPCTLTCPVPGWPEDSKGKTHFLSLRSLGSIPLTVSSPGMRGVAYKSMKVLWFTSKLTWIDLLFQILLCEKQCYPEVSIYLRESQWLTITTGISADLKCSQQPSATVGWPL